MSELKDFYDEAVGVYRILNQVADLKFKMQDADLRIVLQPFFDAGEKALAALPHADVRNMADIIGTRDIWLRHDVALPGLPPFFPPVDGAFDKFNTLAAMVRGDQPRKDYLRSLFERRLDDLARLVAAEEVKALTPKVIPLSVAEVVKRYEVNADSTVSRWAKRTKQPMVSGEYAIPESEPFPWPLRTSPKKKAPKVTWECNGYGCAGEVESAHRPPKCPKCGKSGMTQKRLHAPAK